MSSPTATISPLSPHLKDFLGTAGQQALQQVLACCVPVTPTADGSNIRIRSQNTLPPPRMYTEMLPCSERSYQTIQGARKDLEAILSGKDPRKVLIVGPCSIHDPASGLEYARRLKALAEEPTIKEKFLIVMRAYFEKPRTTVGWKGLINDPELNGQGNLALGYFVARAFLSKVTDLGMPTATEVLETVTPQYIEDLVAWTAIGARTVESQPMRLLASGLSTPVGMKNGTSGSLSAAVDAIVAASKPQTFISIDVDGRSNQVDTTGNPFCHVVLRGGETGPNFSDEFVHRVTELAAKAKLSGPQMQVLIDCSHGNSNKDHTRQGEVLSAGLQQIKNEAPIFGFMIESNILPGNTKHNAGEAIPLGGISITDACLGFEETATLLRDAAKG